MTLCKFRMVFSIVLSLLVITVIHVGCLATHALEGEKGIDISSIKEGIPKAEVEKILGSPIHRWSTSLNIQYCVYNYDAGMPPSKWDAIAHVFMDIVTLGAWELFGAIEKEAFVIRKTEKMAIAYDKLDIVMGVFDQFDDFDVLPSDGRSNSGKFR